MSDESSAVKTPPAPTPIKTPVTTEVPNAADVTFEEANDNEDNKEPELNSEAKINPRPNH